MSYPTPEVDMLQRQVAKLETAMAELRALVETLRSPATRRTRDVQRLVIKTVQRGVIA
jgi:prefoldin subunit 5